jgi:hypothetical protein
MGRPGCIFDFDANNAITGFASTVSGADRVWTWISFTGADHYRASLDDGATWSGNLATAAYTATGKANATHTVLVQALDSLGNVIGQGTGGWTVGNASRMPWLEFSPVIGRF